MLASLSVGALQRRAGLSKSYPFSSWIPNWTAAAASTGTISTWHGHKGFVRHSGHPADACPGRHPRHDA